MELMLGKRSSDVPATNRLLGLQASWYYWVDRTRWGAAKKGLPRNPPPFLGVFYSYTLRRHPKTLNTNTAPSMRLLWGMLGPRLVMPNFGVFLETPFWAGTPPFLDSSYDPAGPKAIAHKSVRWGLNRIVPPH